MFTVVRPISESVYGPLEKDLSLTSSQNLFSFEHCCVLYFLVQPFYLLENKCNGNESRFIQGLQNQLQTPVELFNGSI